MFIAIPTGMNYQTERLPMVTFALIGINTVVWVISLVLKIQGNENAGLWMLQYLWFIPSLSYWWTYLTSMFVHAGFFHLLGNMIFLFLFGSCVEDLIGRARFIAFYLLGGLAAVLVYVAMIPEHFASASPLGGASGAISACMGMYLLLRAGADIEFKYFFWFLVIRAGEFEIPAWVAIMFWFLKDLLFAVLGMTATHRGGGVAFGAHVGGFLAGLTLVAIYKQFWRVREPEPEPALKNIAALPPRATRHQPAPVVTETPTIYLHDGLAQSGPFTLTQVQEMLRLGSISAEVSYWSEGLTEWQSVKDLSDTPLE